MQLQVSLAPIQMMKMSITPQLQQSINVLQYSSDELAAFIEQQSVENPLLEVVWSASGSKRRKSVRTSFDRADFQDPFLHSIGRPGDTLEASLLSQLRMNGLSGKRYTISQYLAGNINEEGYLTVTLEEACEACGARMADALAALEAVQSLEPAGVGARNLKECLELQIRRDPNADPWAYRVVSSFLNELGGGKLKRIAKQLHVPIEELEASVDYIRRLNPRPVTSADQQEVKTYIQADAVIRKDQEDYIVVMNDKHIPKLAINERYSQLLANNEYSEAGAYLRSSMQSAKWLMRCLEQRRSTLYSVICAIVEEQRGFFERGVLGVSPMNLRDIAEKLGIHESTVSRATQNKYVQTPHGLFELKFFFTSGLSIQGGGEASSESIKAKIKQMIDKEDKRCPLSDQAITDRLVRDGIQISRRTVMKYREELRLLSSRLRYSE